MLPINATPRRVCKMKAAPDWSTRPHAHKDAHQLIVILQGKLYASMLGKEYDLTRGHVVWYPKNVTHEERTDPEQPVEMHFLAFEWDQDHREIPVVVHDELGRIRTIISWMFAERFAPETPATSHLLRSLFQSLMTEYLRLTFNTMSVPAQKAREYMREHIHDNIRLEDVAAHAGMSKYHFIREFKKETGRSPIQDLRLMRIEYARDLIISTELPLKAIAPMAGLGDEYQLSRYFRKYLNITPGSLRK